MQIMAVLNAGAVVLLAACGFLVAPSGSPAIDAYSGIPEIDDGGSSDGAVYGPGNEPVVVWTDRGSTFAVVLWGSGSCPHVPASLDVISSHEISLIFEPDGDEFCTLDSSPFTHEFAVPAGASDLPLTITLALPAGPESLVIDRFVLADE